MDTPNAGAGSEELPARRVPKADYRTKAWRERTLKQDDAGIRLTSPAAPLAIVGVAHWRDVRAVPLPCSPPAAAANHRPPCPY
jgi:hypothetical protein